MIVILFFIVTVIAIGSYFIFRKRISNPTFLFASGFALQSLIGIFYIKKWQLNLHLNTFLVIALGVTEFFLTCVLINFIVKKAQNKKGNEIKNAKLTLIDIKLWKKLVLIAIIAVIGIIYLKSIYKVVLDTGFESHKFKDVIARYDALLKFTETGIKIPFIASNLFLFTTACGYFFAYVIANNFLVNKKLDITNAIIFLICIILSTFSGSRTNSIMLLVALFIDYVVLKEKANVGKSPLGKKELSIIGIVMVVLVVTFFSFGKALGRNLDGLNKADYVAEYLGAEVKNLDIFLQTDIAEHRADKPWGSQTFFSLVLTFGEKLHLKNYKPYNLDLPQNRVNQYDLGNVYTTFYQYIYDFGYIGEVVLVFIMAAISELVYEGIKYDSKNKKIILAIAYSNIANCLVFSFFSNKFYENIIAMNFLKNIIFWWVLYLFLVKIDFKRLFDNIKKTLKKDKKEVKESE